MVKVFAALDDHKRLAGHMSKPSLMMAGTTMTIETDPLEGKAVGSEIRLRGRVLGIPIFVVERVVEYTAPFRKVWQTTTEPRLLVIGSYRMGFELMPQAQATVLRLWIDYALPSVFFPRLIGEFWLAFTRNGVWTKWSGMQRMGFDAYWCALMSLRKVSPQKPCVRADIFVMPAS